MKALRRVILWGVLGTIGLMAILSIVGAFLHPVEPRDLETAQPLYQAWLVGLQKFEEMIGLLDARELFNSRPLIVFWFLLLAALLAGFIFFRRLLTAPAGLAMHLGSLLILAGAMWGSAKGHEWRHALFGSDKVQSGYLVLGLGETDNRLLASDMRTPVGELPFMLTLKDFWLDYWPSPEKRWGLMVVTPPPDDSGPARQRQLAWEVGGDIAIPMTSAHLKVLQYIESARPVYPPGAKAVLKIGPPGSEQTEIAAEAGKAATLKKPEVKVEVLRVFKNLKVVGGGAAGHEVIDAPGGENPALEIRVTRPDGGDAFQGYLPALAPSVIEGADGLVVEYAVPQPTGAEADASTGLPAMEIQLTAADREQRQWLIPRPGDRYVELPLGPFLRNRSPSEGFVEGPILYLLQPLGPVKAYNSDVVATEGGKQVAAAVVQVNHPLRYGGYHLYQSSYDHNNESYTVIEAVSDSGLAAVWLGFILLVAGAFGRFWIAPAWAGVRRRGAHGR
jgi:hypothetical protein